MPGAGALNAEKHLYEEIFYVVEGRGSTEVWLDGDNRRHIFEWQTGSLFSIPVNAWHRIVNASSAPALLLGGTTAPNLMNLINNTDAIFNCPFQFRDRFSGADDFYRYKDDIEPDPVRGLAMRRTNFIPDIVNCDLPLDNRRSPGYRRVEPFMTGNTFYLWIAQHENGRYSKAHAHTSAAVLICLKGKGYTYTWPERNGVTPWQDGKETEIKRVDYEPVGMVSAAPGGARWFHQHFGVSKEPLRFTAWFGPNSPGREPGPPGETHTDYTGMDIPEGGTAIPYWMEDPFIRREYEATLTQERRAEPDEPGVLQPGLQGRAAEGIMECNYAYRSTYKCIWQSKLGFPNKNNEGIQAMTEESEGGRIFFSSTGRTLAEEDEICVLSVGVDIGSSTSHLVFSRIVLERLDSRYVVTERETFYQSDILLTPYAAEETIDAAALGAFIEQQYADAKVDPDEIDTGALILTGVAVRRSNARAIGELFARQAGKLVAVSAGDNLETVMAAYGSGAVARSIRDQTA